MKLTIRVLLIQVVCFSLALTSCQTPAFQQWLHNRHTQSELKSLQSWAVEAAVLFIQTWLADQMPAAKNLAQLRALFVKQGHAAASSLAPDASGDQVDATLGAAFDKAITAKRF